MRPSQVWSRQISQATLLWLWSAVLPAACAHHRVVAFSVEPTLACRGQMVDVKWNVQGRASLRTAHGGGPESDELVPSQGERKVTLDQPTTFTVRALDANPADGQAFAAQSVEMPQAPVFKAANATCDPASGKCRGTFTLATTGSGVLVRSIAAPRIVQDGHVQPVRICVTHAGLAVTCIAGDGKADVAVAAGGDWTLESDLQTGANAAINPQLRIQLGFGCP